MKTFSRVALATLIMLGICGMAHSEERYGADAVVAKRGDAVVTMLDVDAALLRAPKSMRANVMNNPKRIEELIERLLLNRQLAMEGSASKLDQGVEFKQAVKQQEEGLLAELRLLNLRSEMDVGNVEQLALERYQVNPDAYKISGLTSARHILIDTKTRSDEAARTLADEVYAKAIAGGDFDALVAQYSDDPSKASNNGLIVNADSDSMDAAFAAAVKQLAQSGDVSPVTKSSFGYHIINWSSALRRARSFEDVKQQIVASIENVTETRVQEHVDELRACRSKRPGSLASCALDTFRQAPVRNRKFRKARKRRIAGDSCMSTGRRPPQRGG